jgi:hypothetical protein
MNLHEDFLRRVALLNGANYQDLTRRVPAIVDWLERQPQTHDILTDLRTHQVGASEAGTLEQVAAVGLHVAEKSRMKPLWMAAQEATITGHEIEFGLMAEQAMTRFIRPFLSYVGEQLERAAINFVPASIAEHRVADFIASPAFDKLFPDTRKRFENISGEFLRPDNQVEWQNIANSCRQALIDFVVELKAVLPTTIPDHVKSADVKEISRCIIRDLYAPGRYRDTLEALIQAIWNHVQPAVHRPATTQAEALRIYMWAALGVDEIANLVIAILKT